MERNNEYLEERLFNIWEDFFIDIPRKNLVLIKFGKYSKRQLGSIKWATRDTKIQGILKKKKDEYLNQDDSRISVISITKYFQNLNIPEYVIDGTIAHELVHYVHGFHSPLEKKYNHPHKGGIVRKELIKRGLGDVYKQSEVWLKANWRKVI
ncbi:hypothetical protein M0R04_02325 [Candidatus Dojkabacteria bacterium]|jgi:hypothetical protein|nr:hypothetical protein [Candidatus Dojkabacteria bacterium]